MLKVRTSFPRFSGLLVLTCLFVAACELSDVSSARKSSDSPEAAPSWGASGVTAAPGVASGVAEEAIKGAGPSPVDAGVPAMSWENAQTVFEARCTVCHGCYDAPCQAVMSAPEGLARGASKILVYDGERSLRIDPTRLFVDAQTVPEWRQKGFYSILDEAHDRNLVRLMLELGATNIFPPGEKLPDAVPVGIDHILSCPTPEEFPDYMKEHPLWGMPYGTAPLSGAEMKTLSGWLDADAPTAVSPKELSARATEEVAVWEKFLNGDSLRDRIVNRYLYEHWFLAHVYFDDLPEGPFFRVVRSTTPPGQPVAEIASRRPYDPPEVDEFWYRLRPITGTILHKTHTLYELGDARMERLQELFYGTPWTPTKFPSYEPELASNPFITYTEVPARARYQYMLDDAQYFVMTFIRGPVCRGQIAVNVIEDHFFVAFLDPDADLSVTQPDFLREVQEDLNLPGEYLSQLTPGEFFLQYTDEQRDYLELRNRYYDEAYPDGAGLDTLWDGDRTNPNAMLTIFRHWNNATVIQGWTGGWPKTAWVIDYPIFERIYYDLVAGFDVFGNFADQAATRLYMDHLRMQGENNFLDFLPADRRKEVHASWYVGATESLNYRWADELLDTRPTPLEFKKPDVKIELLEKIFAYNGAVSGGPDFLNRCDAIPCARPDATAFEMGVDAILEPLAAVKGPWVAPLPEVSRLRVINGETKITYTLVHNLAHTNVAYMFDEDARLVPANDTVTLVRGYLGSYPNFAFDVDHTELIEFRDTLMAVKDATGLEAVVDRWGVRRTDPDFWSTMDWFVEDFRRRQPTAAGLFDLGRYENL